MKKKCRTQEIKLKSLKAFKDWIFQWSEKIFYPHLVLLNGPMGAGKTEWVRSLVEALSSRNLKKETTLREKKKQILKLNKIKNQRKITQSLVTSPSFSFHNRYQIGKIVINHIDFYRIKNEEDLESTGFWDFFENPHGMIIIEWAHRFPLNSHLFQGEVTEIEITPLEDSKENKKKLKEKKREKILENKTNSQLNLESLKNERRRLKIRSFS